MKCLLIGVNHGYQYDGNESVDTIAFRNFLREVQSLHRVQLLAEELNSEAIKKTRYEGVTGSIAENIAREADIAHLHCDPTQDERKQLGIPTREEIVERLGYKGLPCLTSQQGTEVSIEEKKYWDIRERFWLDKLVSSLKEKIIFVVGACHVNRFKVLLDENGHVSQILVEHWKP